MAIYRPDTRDINREREILISPFYEAERMQIRSMLAALRRAREGEEVLALHQHLLDRSRALQEARQRFESDIRDRRAEIREAKEPKAEVGVFKRLSGELKQAELHAAVVRPCRRCTAHSEMRSSGASSTTSAPPLPRWGRVTRSRTCRPGLVSKLSCVGSTNLRQRASSRS